MATIYEGIDTNHSRYKMYVLCTNFFAILVMNLHSLSDFYDILYVTSLYEFLLIIRTKLKFLSNGGPPTS